MTTNYTQHLLRIAREAAAEIIDVYGGPFDVDFKSHADPVTEADRRANALICARLQDLFGDVPIVAEESPEEEWAHFRDSEEVFFVDPLDGTREFVRRTDQFVVMIGRLVGNVPTHGVIFSPVSQIAWIGDSENGAHLIGPDGARRPIHVAEPESLRDARVVASRSHPTSLLERALLDIDCQTVMPVHSAGLKGASVASAEAHIYLAPESAGCRWDSCAPEAIIRAAGGVYTDSRGDRLDYRAARLENHRGIVAAAPRTHGLVIKRLQPLFE